MLEEQEKLKETKKKRIRRKKARQKKRTRWISMSRPEWDEEGEVVDWD